MKAQNFLEQLVNKAKQGNAEAFGEIYDLLVERIYKFVFFRVNTTEEAEDITEEVFIKAWKNLDKFSEKGYGITAWLYKIARNLVIDHYRGMKESEDLENYTGLIDSSPGPEETFFAKAEKEMVFEALKKIKDSYSEILTLKYVNDLTNSEIAEILEMKEAHVRVLLSRAVQSLKNKLNETTNTN